MIGVNIYKLLFYNYLLLLFVVLGSYHALSQTYIAQPKTINYTKSEYNAGTQNWKISQDEQGRMYFANNEGVLVFDGAKWQLHPLPNHTIVRSICFGADERLYTGGQDEIGYFAPDKKGILVFTSLKSIIPKTDQVFSDLWDIVSYGNDVFFRSNDKIFKYSKGKIAVYRSHSWLFLGIHQNQLLAHDEQRGVLKYINGKWQSFIESKNLPTGFYITSLSKYSTSFSLLTTSKSGVFVLSGNTLRSFNLHGYGIDNFQHFSGAVALDDGTYILSTYLNGIYQINRNGEVLENLSKKEGLQNPFVRTLYADADHNIWLGLDNGIDLVAYNNSIKHISPAIFKDGGGYATAFYHNKLHFALSNGIYQVPVDEMGDLSYVKNNLKVAAQGQTWNLTTIGGHLLAGKDDGIFDVLDGRIAPVYNITGFWIFQQFFNRASQPFVAAGSYYGIRVFENAGGVLVDKGNVGKYYESARFLQVDEHNLIWTSHPYRGVYCINPVTNQVKHYTDNQGLPSANNNFIFKLKGRVVVATEKGIYEYNAGSNRFKPSAAFKPVFGTRSIRYLKEDHLGNIWFVEGKNLSVVDYSAKPVIVNFPELNNRVLSGFENVYPINAENIFVGSENGFYHINYARYKKSIRALRVYLRSVRTGAGKDSVLFGGYSSNNKNTKPVNLAYALNSLNFEYSSPVFESPSNVEYRYYLEGFDKGWSEWTKRTEKDYTNLPAGEYTFKIVARSQQDTQSNVSAYMFTISPPWYRSIWAYLIYGVAIAGLLYIIHQKQEQRLIAKQEKELHLQQQNNEEEQRQLAYQHQLKMERSEKELANLKNEKLQAEVEFKTSELASSALNLVQQKEFLSKIKEEMSRLQKTGNATVDTSEIKRIQRMLIETDNINERWEQFSVHFDKVHAGFLSLLKSRYPTINQQELKLCAYLVMNLSSKEIAQLMAISVRGVEISRYRLRKKLQIPTEVNLFEFLFAIQRELLKP